MDTLSMVLKTIELEGYSSQFKALHEGLYSFTSERTYSPEQVKVAHFYRFEGDSNPDDSSILYAIETQNGEKGTLVDAYGPDGDSFVTLFMQAVSEIHK